MCHVRLPVCLLQGGLRFHPSVSASVMKFLVGGWVGGHPVDLRTGAGSQLSA